MKRLQNITTVLLALVFMIGWGTAYADTWNGTDVATDYAGGSGTEADPFRIETAAQLAYFATKSSTLANKYVKLNANIDLGGNYWVNGTASGYGSGKEFKGHFFADTNGDGTPKYTISNFKLKVPNTASQYGLFSKVTGGSIKNINVSNVTIEFASNMGVVAQVGGLVGYASTNTTVENCHVTNVKMELKGISGNGGYGGLIGYLGDKSTITGCSSTNFTMTSSSTITTGGQSALIGSTAGKAHVISNCKVNNASYTVNAEYKGGGLGGIVGYYLGVSATSRAKITDCTVNGSTITLKTCSTNAYVAHLAGQIKWGDVSGCKVTGTQAAPCSITVSSSGVTANTITGNTFLGGVVGYMQGGTSVENSSSEHTTFTVYGNIASNAYIGGLVANAAAPASFIKCSSSHVTITANGNCASTRAGGLLGYVKGSSNAARTLVTNCNSTNTTITFAKNISGTNYFGGYVGYSDSYVTHSDGTVTGSNITFNGTFAATSSSGVASGVAATNTYNTIKGLTLNNNAITITGNITAASCIGGLLGYVKGVNNTCRTLIEGNHVNSQSISLNGASIAGVTYYGGIVGYSFTYVNIFNNKVEDPSIAIRGAVNAATYLSAGVAYLSTYDTLDGLYIKGGSITGPDAMKGIKNNTEFFFGGALAKQIAASATSVATQQSQARNLAVEGMNINLGNYQPVQGVMSNHKFIVGGVIAQTNNTHSAADESGIPQNLISKDVKLYAPQAMTSPLVGGFGAIAYNNYTLDNSTADDDVTKSRAGSWVYSGYKLGLSDAVMNNEHVYDYGGASAGIANGNVTLNFQKSDATKIDGIDYISLDKLKNYNRYYDVEYTSKTVLWWTRTEDITKWPTNTNVEQSIYPQNGTTTAGFLTGDYKYTMYFYQGINHGKEVTDTGASALIAGIDANVTQARTATPVTLTITAPDAKRRGFGEHKLSVAASDGISYTYSWYVDGVKQSVTGNELSVTPHWRFGKGITVNALDASDHVVASASYTLLHGVFKTKNSDNVETDYVGMPIANRGTQENPYVIDCPEALHQLSWVSTLNTAFYWETRTTISQSTLHYNRAYYELEKDIDMGGEEFIPISHAGTNSSGIYKQDYAFAGHFEGNGNAIRNFKMTWRGGQYKGDSYQNFGLFGIVGWGTSTTEEYCTIQNLVIDNAQLVHDKDNTSFYYNNGTTGTDKNNVQLGILAGMVTARTTIQNVEVRNSKITDEGSSDYNMAGKYLAVGGMIGRVQQKYNGTGDLANSVTLRFLSANCDISLTHAAFDGESLGTPTRFFSIGGIVGSLNSTTSYASIEMPIYSYFTGKVDAKLALVGPCFGSVEYNGLGDDDYSNYWQRYMAKSSSATESIPNVYYGNYQIQTYTSSGKNKLETITGSNPAMTCPYGGRTITYHDGIHPNDATFYTADHYFGEYQGVNYGDPAITSGDQGLLEGVIEEAMQSYPELSRFYLVFVDGQLRLLKEKPLKIFIVDTPDAENSNNHTLKINGNVSLDGYTFKWYKNSATALSETGGTITTTLGTTPQLIYAEAYKNGEKITTSSVVDFPRTITSLTASYSPERKKDITGTFDGVFTVTTGYMIGANEAETDPGYVRAYDWTEWKYGELTEQTHTAESAAAANAVHLTQDSSGKNPGETGYVTTYEGTQINDANGVAPGAANYIPTYQVLVEDENGIKPGQEDYTTTYQTYVVAQVGDKYYTKDDGSWKEFAGGSKGDAATSTTTGADKAKTYKCSITATDETWQSFINSLEESSPYYEAKDLYSSILKYEILVRLRDAKVVFLHPKQESETFSGVTIPAGSDSWDDLSGGELGDQSHPVRTWGKAYSLLDTGDETDWDDNKIVLVGTSTGVQTWGTKDGTTRCYNPTPFSVSEYGLSNTLDRGTTNSEFNMPKYDEYLARIAQSPMAKNVTISGEHEDVDYHAILESPQKGVTSGRLHIHLFGNTKFEHLTFYGSGSRDYDVIMCHYHDLWMGEGLIMKNYMVDKDTYGTITGVSTPRFQIFGGMQNDCRFNPYYDDKTGELDRMLQKTVPNGEKGFTLTFRSGFYSIICVGSRQTTPAGMQGSLSMPIKCTIDVDLDQKWNKEHQMGTMAKGGSGPDKDEPDDNLCTPYDIALILAGNHEGPMCADVDINVKSGRIARIVNGSLGALRDATYKYGSSTNPYPKNTYFGRANILLDPASSEKAKDITDIDRRVIVTELYNGGVGRALGSDGEIDMPTIAKNTVVMKGGTIGFPDQPQVAYWTDANNRWVSFVTNENIIPGLYGGGAGGMNGIGYGAVSDKTHVANTALLPYWEDKTFGVFAFDNYETYLSKTGDSHLTIRCYNADTKNYTDFDPLDTSSEITIEGGKIGTETSPANVFGAGSGFTSTQFLGDASSSYPNTLAGNMYARSKDAVVATVNIKGGTIYGNVYGAGRGTDYYYKQNRKSKAESYKALGQTYGSVVTNISDNALIYGNVYGAGAGVAEAKMVGASDYTPLTETALLKGNAVLNIGGTAQIKSYTLNNVTYGGNVYGGGMLAKTGGNTTVNISGNAQISGSVFGGAQGISGKTDTSAQTMEGTTATYILNTPGNNKLFGIIDNNTNVTITGNATIGGNVYGGGNNGEVHGTTSIQVGDNK